MRYLLIPFLLFVLTGCENSAYKDAYKEGSRACRLGVEASANPHIGQDYLGKHWLRGWMDEKEKAK